MLFPLDLLIREEEEELLLMPSSGEVRTWVWKERTGKRNTEALEGIWR